MCIEARIGKETKEMRKTKGRKEEKEKERGKGGKGKQKRGSRRMDYGLWMMGESDKRVE